MKNKKYLYLVQCNNTNFYKIGVAKTPEERLQALQIGCPYPLTLIYKRGFKKAVKVERLLHKKYRSKQKIGEWFELSASEIELIQQPRTANEMANTLFPNHIPMLNKIRAKDNLPPIGIYNL